MLNIDLNESRLITLFVESATWGLFSIFYVMSLRALLWDEVGRLKGRRSLNWLMVVTVNAMFIIGTLHVSLNLYQCLDAFSRLKTKEGPRPEAVFKNVSTWNNVIEIVTGSLQGLIFDCILIYRCWLVYNHRWVMVAFSIVLWLGAFATSIAALYYTMLLKSFATINVAITNFYPAMVATLACSIALNILTTGLIVYRIWSVDTKHQRILAMTHFTNPSGEQTKIPLSGLRKAMVTIIESGVLYTGVSIITFITFVIPTNSSYISSYMQVQVAGIAFTLIIVRAASTSRHPADASKRGVQLTALSDPIFTNPSSHSHVQVSFSRPERDLEGEEDDEEVDTQGSKHPDDQEASTSSIKCNDDVRE